MANAKEMNESGNRVVRNHAFREVVLMSPAHSKLVSSQFHPNTIYGVFWNDGRLINGQMLTKCVDWLVMEGFVALQLQAVHAKFEVVANLIKRGVLFLIIAGNEEERQKQ